MDIAKTHSSVKGKFERKEKNGKKNPKYVDLLEEDKPIANQKFACISFVSPENILKQKEREYIQKYDRQGIEILNIRGTRKDTGNKKRK